jgi:hypothetical protein
LEQAIRTESAAALMHFFGIRTTLVWRWRKWLGVGGHRKTPGSRRLHQDVSELGAAVTAAKDWTDEETDRKSAAAVKAGVRPPPRWEAAGWTDAQKALLGTAEDAVIGRRIGRTVGAVRCKRTRAGIRTFRDRRFRAFDTRRHPRAGFRRGE